MGPFRKRHPPAGSRPGTLVSSDEAVAPELRLTRYREDAHEVHHLTDLAQLDALIEPGWTLWLDVAGLGDLALLEELGRRFSLHPLLLEDIVNVPQRPKVETYGDRLVLITRMLTLREDFHLEAEQLTIVARDDLVLTFQERPGDVLDPVRARIAEGEGRQIRGAGAGYLAYVLIDAVIDAYYPVLEAIGDRLEVLEDLVIRRPEADTLAQVRTVRGTLLAMRRAVWPQREAINQILRDRGPNVGDELVVYYRDVYDHLIQSADVLESYREVASGLLNTYLTVISNRTNDVMRVLTVMASIFIPLTFIAGVYGMNFDYMPETHRRWAYPAVLLLMLVVAGGMVWWFRRRGWIGRGDGED